MGGMLLNIRIESINCYNLVKFVNLENYYFFQTLLLTLLKRNFNKRNTFPVVLYI